LHEVKGYDFNQGLDYSKLVKSFETSGLLGHDVNQAIQLLNTVIPLQQAHHINPAEKQKCKLLIGFTSNMISCGIREVICFLVKHKFVDAIVTTTGAIEEDVMKCMSDTYVEEYEVDDKAWRKIG
jgi:deoxyhypusine synthase